MAKQKLKLDFEALFPSESVEIGDQTVEIRPLGIGQLAQITKKLVGIGKLLVKENITWNNYNKQENIVKLAILLLEKFPSVLEDASNIDVNDLLKLPVDIVVDIFDKVIEVNLKSKDKLAGNFESLAKKFKVLQVENQTPEK